MQVISTNNKKIARNTIFLYARMLLVLVVSLITTRILLHALGVDDYGVNNVVCGFVSMFSFLNTSMSNGIQRFYNFSLGKQSDYSIGDVYSISVFIQLIIALFFLIVLETLGTWYIYNLMNLPLDRVSAAYWIFQFSVVSLVLLLFQTPYSAAIMAYERMDYYAYLSIFDVVAKLVIAYSVKYASVDKLILYGALNLTVSIINFLLYYTYAKRHFASLKFSHKIRKALFKPMLSFSGWNIFGSVAYMIKGQGLNLLLNFFCGTIVNAARGVSNMVMSAIQGFQANIVVAFRPQLVQSYAEGNKDRVLKLFYSLSKISFILLAILSIPIIIEINYILCVWLGDNIPDYTVSFTVLALLNMIISSLNTPVSQVVHATGKMRGYQVGTSITICSILPISWLCLKVGANPNAVYCVSLFVTIVNQIVCNFLLKRVFDYSIKDYLKKVIIPCCLFFVLVPILPIMISMFIPSSFFRLVLTVALSAIMSLIVSYFIVLDKTEKNILVGFIRKSVNNE